MAKESKAMSVITIPLKTEIWQEDMLFKRFELCRKVYNAMLSYKIKQYRKMERDPRYIESKKVIFDAYKLTDKKEKAEAKKSAAYKEAADTQKALLKEFGMSEFDFIGEVARFASVYKENISSYMANISIAKPMWAAFYNCLFGNGEEVSFKKYDTWNSIATDGKSGIRLVNEAGKTVLHRSGNEKLWCVCGTNKGKVLKMPLKIDEKDTYLLEMLDRDIKIVRITRKKVRGKYKYYVQLTVTGVPAIKYDKETGEIKHNIGKGKVGIYIDTTSVTICNDDGIIHMDLSDKIPNFEEEIAEQQRIMDKVSRLSNPDNYNEDGTIKKGIMVDGKKRKLTWIRTNTYNNARNKKANLQRIEKEQRIIQRNVLANEILSYGDEIIVNDYNFQAAAMRKKFQEGEELTESGRPKKKKKAGKTIGHNAPAMLITLIDNKLKAAGYDGVKKIKLSDVDYSDGYRQYYAKKMFDEN